MISAIAGFLLWNEYGTDYLITAGLGAALTAALFVTYLLRYKEEGRA